MPRHEHLAPTPRIRHSRRAAAHAAARAAAAAAGRPAAARKDKTRISTARSLAGPRKAGSAGADGRRLPALIWTAKTPLHSVKDRRCTAALASAQPTGKLPEKCPSRFAVTAAAGSTKFTSKRTTKAQAAAGLGSKGASRATKKKPQLAKRALSRSDVARCIVKLAPHTMAHCALSGYTLRLDTTLLGCYWRSETCRMAAFPHAGKHEGNDFESLAMLQTGPSASRGDQIAVSLTAPRAVDAATLGVAARIVHLNKTLDIGRFVDRQAPVDAIWQLFQRKPASDRSKCKVEVNGTSRVLDVQAVSRHQQTVRMAVDPGELSWIHLGSQVRKQPRQKRDSTFVSFTDMETAIQTECQSVVLVLAWRRLACGQEVKCVAGALSSAFYVGSTRQLRRKHNTKTLSLAHKRKAIAAGNVVASAKPKKKRTAMEALPAKHFQAPAVTEGAKGKKQRNQNTGASLELEAFAVFAAADDEDPRLRAPTPPILENDSLVKTMLTVRALMSLSAPTPANE